MRKTITTVITLFCTLFLLSCSAYIKDVTPGEDADSYVCTYKGTKRRFILCLPENYIPDSVPLIIMLHGYGSSAYFFKNQTEFHTDANAANYAVVYVTGIPRQDMPGSSNGYNYSNDKYGKQDLSFLSDLAEYLQKKYSLNRKKLFAVGFSNGGFMCNNIAVKKNNTFTAVASVAGMMPKNVWDVRRKKSRISFLQINGTKDDVVPMRRNGSNKYNPNPAMEDVIEYFAASNNVQNELTTEKLSDSSEMSDYGNKVRWILTDEGRHGWPSPGFCGYNVNKAILDFFSMQ